MLGLIVFPKERSFELINVSEKEFFEELQKRGVVNSTFNKTTGSVQEFVRHLRNAIAHFGITFISTDNQNLINNVRFDDRTLNVAEFKAEELLIFVK